MGDLTANFSKSEFESGDGAPMPPEVQENIKVVAKNLQVLRDELGKSIKINSGYRSPEHNDNIGGSRNSQHKLGTAADIVVTGVKPNEVHQTIETLIEQGKLTQGGLGKYNTFTHYDIRGTRARWGGH